MSKLHWLRRVRTRSSGDCRHMHQILASEFLIEYLLSGTLVDRAHEMKICIYRCHLQSKFSALAVEDVNA